MSFEYDGAVAVITGATRGIGRETALALGRAGARVIIVGRTTTAAPHQVLPGTLESVVAELEAEGIEARSIRADVTDANATQRIIDCTLEWYGGCDVLINNAAFTSNGGILDVPWGRWEKGFRVQVVTPVQLIQGFVPGMLERGTGRVVNVSTEAAGRLARGVGLYSITKSAMERLNDYLHFELGGQGVSFNALHIDVGVTTETWQWVRDNQGEEMVTLGGEVSGTASPEAVGKQIEWMVSQPASWSGNIVGCYDIGRLGGPGV
jgi:NAD(P)-dependent dehydrogenase (short-subunit alcohol dehydrogenase family)